MTADTVAGCALLVIDLQNDFCHPDGVAGRRGDSTENVRATMPRVHWTIDQAREIGVPVVFIRTENSKWSDSPAWHRRPSVAKAERAGIGRVSAVWTGTWGAEFYEVGPEDGELVLTKYRYSAFPYTPLEPMLRNRRIETVYLAGTQTNCCIMATGNDALAHGFSAVMIRDATATKSQEVQESAEREFRSQVGYVLDAAEVVSRWREAAQEEAAATVGKAAV
jgi:ureidoacrylate peracid hydrolase